MPWSIVQLKAWPQSKAALRCSTFRRKAAAHGGGGASMRCSHFGSKDETVKHHIKYHSTPKSVASEETTLKVERGACPRMNNHLVNNGKARQTFENVSVIA
eukprot:6196450-Pleurochrysis_carterae.AAC.1